MTMYLLLGVQESATEHQIRAAYRSLARRYHPDVSTSPDSKTFDRIHQAYNVLSNNDQRLQYDSWLRESRETEKKALALIPKPSPAASRNNIPRQETPPPQPSLIVRKGTQAADWFTGAIKTPTYTAWG